MRKRSVDEPNRYVYLDGIRQFQRQFAAVRGRDVDSGITVGDLQ
jgi:hypothetical protein